MTKCHLQSTHVDFGEALYLGEATSLTSFRSEMTLNYWMIVERYPKRTEWLVVQLPAVKIISLVDEKLARWSSASCVPGKRIS
jgi:hypothetical protein